MLLVISAPIKISSPPYIVSNENVSIADCSIADVLRTETVVLTLSAGKILTLKIFETRPINFQEFSLRELVM